MFPLIDLIFAPSACVDWALGRGKIRLWPWILATVFLVPLAHSFASGLASREGLASFGLGFAGGYWVKVAVFGLANLLAAGLVHFIATLTDRSADAPLFLGLFILCWFPVGLMPAVGLAASWTGPAAGILTSVAWLAVLVWVVLLQVRVTRRIFGLTAGRTVLVFAASAATVVLLAFLGGLLLLLTAAGAA